MGLGEVSLRLQDSQSRGQKVRLVPQQTYESFFDFEGVSGWEHRTSKKVPPFRARWPAREEFPCEIEKGKLHAAIRFWKSLYPDWPASEKERNFFKGDLLVDESGTGGVLSIPHKD